ncbi:hypothetical protein JOE65_000342 [Arthrobacter roseus]|nr:hypothetical protein [Arthrobacter roseus]
MAPSPDKSPYWVSDTLFGATFQRCRSERGVFGEGWSYGHGVAVQSTSENDKPKSGELRAVGVPAEDRLKGTAATRRQRYG